MEQGAQAISPRSSLKSHINIFIPKPIHTIMVIGKNIIARPIFQHSMSSSYYSNIMQGAPQMPKNIPPKKLNIMSKKKNI